MKPALAALMMSLLVAACGVDGPPERPAPAPQTPAKVSVSGEAQFGVVTEL